MINATTSRMDRNEVVAVTAVTIGSRDIPGRSDQRSLLSDRCFVGAKTTISIFLEFSSPSIQQEPQIPLRSMSRLHLYPLRRTAQW